MFGATELRAVWMPLIPSYQTLHHRYSFWEEHNCLSTVPQHCRPHKVQCFQKIITVFCEDSATALCMEMTVVYNQLKTQAWFIL